MTNATVGVLGQVSPGAGGTSDLYAGTAGRKMVGSTIFVCNTTAGTITYRIFIRKAGNASGTGTAVAYDVPLDANTADPWTVGAAIGPTDIITVGANTAGVTFTLCGEESDIAA